MSAGTGDGDNQAGAGHDEGRAYPGDDENGGDGEVYVVVTVGLPRRLVAAVLSMLRIR